MYDLCNIPKEGKRFLVRTEVDEKKGERAKEDSKNEGRGETMWLFNRWLD